MTDTLRHRGPDGDGIFCDTTNQVWLGHRRLSVIDIAGGQQPMANEDGKIQVVFNGEIYNHKQLRAELTSAGHVFHSDHSDTEVLVHGYEEWGSDLPERLNGMFAFAIYDIPRKRLFLARDRFGKKPLFYHFDGARFLFASELTAFQYIADLSLSFSKKGLMKFFGYGYFPAPYTPYEQIQKLPAGHFMNVDLPARTMVARPYWSFCMEPQPVRPGTEADLAAELRHLLREAVRRRLESDVPLGFFLSGGIDSSAVTGLARELMPDNDLFTFSMGFQEPTFDESRFAKIAADKFRTQHITKTCSLDDMKQQMPGILARLDEPTSDSSFLPTTMVCGLAREHVTVALSGDGGDELFGGYDPFHVFPMASAYHTYVPAPVHGFLRTMFDRTWPISEKNMSFGFKVRRALKGLSHAPALWAPHWLGPLEAGEISELFDTHVEPEEVFSEVVALWEASPHLEPADRLTEFFVRFYLQDNILLKVDRASMLNSLEVRAPFLDTDVVEFARRLPMAMKLRHGKGKFILKQAMNGLVPDEILTRPKKGFGIPLTKWLKDLPAPDVDPTPLGLSSIFLRRRWKQHREGKIDDRANLWCWYALAQRYGAMEVSCAS